MTPEQVAALAPALTEYLGEYRECFERQPVFENFEVYCRGLLSGEGRKSVEPLALAAGAAVRTMQVFLRGMKWDEGRMRDLAQRRVADFVAAHAPPGGSGGSGGSGGRLKPGEVGDLGLIDETAVAKKGQKTPGVQRQWCGSMGKKENCVVTVHLGLWQEASGFKAMLDSELFLPESWADDRGRCRAAGIPDSMTHRTKPRIAIELVKRALGNGVHFDFLTYDETYGRDPQFLLDLDGMGLVGVGEVPSNFRCLATLPGGSKEGLVGQEVYDVTRWSKPFVYQPWVSFSVERETLGPQAWDVKAARVHLLRDGKPVEKTFWLLVAWNRETGEYKYFFSNAPADTPLQTLVAVAFKRAHVEHLFRVLKSEVGFGHYEGRNYKGLMRHLTLCQVLLLFLALQAAGLRGEKRRAGREAGGGREPGGRAPGGRAPARDDGAGRPRPQRPVPTVARPPPRAGDDRANLLPLALPAAPQRRRQALTPAPAHRLLLMPPQPDKRSLRSSP
jgi:SRSO17 transposase